jgi:outer membrane protein
LRARFVTIEARAMRKARAMRRGLPIMLAALLCPLAPLHGADGAQAMYGPIDDQGAVDRDDAPDGTLPPRAHGAIVLPSETPAAIRAVAAADAPVDTARTAMALAYWTSPAILAQRALLKSSDYRIAEARAAYGVQLDYQLMAGWQRDRYNPTALQQELGQITPSTSWGWSNSAMAVLTMPLFTFGRNFAAERSAAAQRAYQKQVLRQTEQQALFDALAAYAGLIRDRAGVTIAQDNLAALTRELQGNTIRLKAHEITATDLDLVTTRHAEAEAQVFAAQAAADGSEATFVQKIGARPAATLTPIPAMALPVPAVDDAFAYADAHSPVILAAHERERVSRAGIAAARANLLPRVDLRATALYASQSPYDNYARYNEEIASVVITGPIFESGLRRTQIADATAANDSDWRLIDAATRDTRAAVAAVWHDWQAQQAAAARYATAIRAAQAAYDGALIQQRAGQITTFDVLQVALELLNVRNNANLAQANAAIDAARIMALIGALEPVAVLPGEPAYDDARHLNAVRHQDDLPLITPLLRALDGITTPGNAARPGRDPAAPDR